MRMTVTVTFEGESFHSVTPDRSRTYETAVPLPEVGEVVWNPSKLEGGPLNGKVTSRSFIYSDNHIDVTLVLREKYWLSDSATDAQAETSGGARKTRFQGLAKLLRF